MKTEHQVRREIERLEHEAGVFAQVKPYPQHLVSAVRIAVGQLKWVLEDADDD